MIKKMAVVWLTMLVMFTCIPSFAAENKIVYYESEMENDMEGLMAYSMLLRHCRERYLSGKTDDEILEYVVNAYTDILIEVDETHVVRGVCVREDFETRGYRYYLCYESVEEADKAVAALEKTVGVVWAGKSTLNYHAAWKDVKEDAWYYEAVNKVAGAGIMKGLSENDGYFGPAEALYRPQMAVILYRMAGSPKVAYKNCYTDVEADKWYTDAVIWAYNAGIMTGYENGAFGTADVLTREQLCTVLFRYFDVDMTEVTYQYRIPEAASHEELCYQYFSDWQEVSSFAKDAVYYYTVKGIVKGYGGNCLKPLAACKRAEAAAVISRIMKWI